MHVKARESCQLGKIINTLMGFEKQKSMKKSFVNIQTKRMYINHMLQVTAKILERQKAQWKSSLKRLNQWRLSTKFEDTPSMRHIETY